MTQKEKRLLLLKVLCAGMSYGLKVKIFDESILLYGNNEKGTLDGKETMSDDCFVIKCKNDSWIISCEDFKPYLRPMSSMTEEEFEDLKSYSGLKYDQLDLASYQDGTYKCLDFYLNEIPSDVVVLVFDWLDKNHFDYRGLIPMDLAIEASKEMYKNE